MENAENKTYIRSLTRQGFLFIPAEVVKKMNQPKFLSVKKDNQNIYIAPGKNVFGKEGKNIEVKENKPYRVRIYMGQRFLYEYSENGRPVDMKLTYIEEEQLIVVTPQFTTCTFCGATEGLMTFSNKKICKDCFESLHEIYFDNE